MNSRFSDSTIINYCADKALQRFALVSWPTPQTPGCCQIYCARLKKSQIITAESANFLRFKNSNDFLDLIAIAASSNESKLVISEIMQQNEPNKTGFQKTTQLVVPTAGAFNFVVGLEADNKRGLIFLVWKSGHVAVHDVQTATALCSIHASASIMTTVLTKTGNLLMLDPNGNMFEAILRNECLISYLECQGNLEMVVELAIRLDVSGCRGLFNER